MKALFRADGNALGLKCRQHIDIWKHAIRLQVFVESWGIKTVPGHFEILDLINNNLGKLWRQGKGKEHAEDSWEMSLSFMGSVGLL